MQICTSPAGRLVRFLRKNGKEGGEERQKIGEGTKKRREGQEKDESGRKGLHTIPVSHTVWYLNKLKCLLE